MHFQHRCSVTLHTIRMKKIVLISLLMAAALMQVQAQHARIAPNHLLYLRMLNDSLGKSSVRILDALFPLERIRADSLFTRQLVRGMVVPYSYYFPFDSIEVAPILYPKDSSFRIITWHYTLNEADYRQKGVLQINTSDGSPRFFPLYDASEYTDEPQDSVRDNRNWIGAVYYKLIEKEWQGKKVYFLFGYDENNGVTTRKWIDPLTFTEDGEPRFGGNFFRVPKGPQFEPTNRRYLLEYKTGARARLNYDEEEDMVIMDYLISESNEPEKRYTLVPGGDYSGLRWNNGAWEYIDRLDVYMLGDGNEPRPALILNEDGSVKEEVLQKQSDKNVNKSASENTGKSKKKGKGK